jgi:ABC-type multidrug transport system ATPase subunit
MCPFATLIRVATAAVADELCDRVALIVDGQIKLIDAPRELKLRYGRPRVRVEYPAHPAPCRAADPAIEGERRHGHPMGQIRLAGLTRK